GRPGAGRGRAGGASTHTSSLGLTILRMISLNSLAAFTAEVTRNAGLPPARGVGGVAAIGARPPRDAAAAAAGPALAPAAPQRALHVVPPHPPTHPPPRGSLLDLLV